MAVTPASDRSGGSGRANRVAVHLFVYGRVQGVGFRAWTAMQARLFHIGGWVRNCPDDSVEIFAEGDGNAIECFTDAVRAGNGYSSVSDMQIHRVPPEGFTRFDIDY